MNPIEELENIAKHEENRVKSDIPEKVALAIGMAHEPWYPSSMIKAFVPADFEYIDLLIREELVHKEPVDLRRPDSVKPPYFIHGTTEKAKRLYEELERIKFYDKFRK